MICPYCNRRPHEITEYQEQAKLHELTPESYVKADEGTYNALTDCFCCTSCYIDVGMPQFGDLIKAFKRYRATVIELNR